MFDLTRLRLLRELAQRGTMTAVGAALGQTSSAVSQQLAILEREARAKLLERVGRRVRLTAEGERLAAHAEAILQAVVAAEQDLKGAKEKPKGVLEICCFATFAKARLLPAIGRMRVRYPDLRVIIHELESADAVAAVRDGRCHLAIAFAYSLVPQPEVPGLVSTPLIDEPVVLALPKRWRPERQPIALKRLAREDWIIGSRQADDRQLAERACALAGFAPRMTHTIDDYDLLLRMVAAGLGVGFVPELALSFSDTKAVVLRTPGGVPPLRRRIRALTRAALATSPMVRALLSELG
ncbi:MAG TPA: LysR substrate-binding domain-containing protein [Dongiaceae bacterium]|jgi:DNA-binding transcriptional LysR family regulator|nr:LysR substrate-binding domain-containing protein [Dongiaceae bacterium]